MKTRMIIIAILLISLVGTNTRAQNKGIYIAFAYVDNIQGCASYETDFLGFEIMSASEGNGEKAIARLKKGISHGSKYDVTFNGPNFENNYVVILVGTTDYKTNSGKCQRNVMKFVFAKTREEALAEADRKFNLSYKGWGVDRSKAPVYKIVADGRY